MPQTIPQTGSAAVEAVRHLPCTTCWAAPGTPCQREPEADHLQRWIGAYTLRRVGRDDMAAVFARLKVITKHAVVPADVTP